MCAVVVCAAVDGRLSRLRLCLRRHGWHRPWHGPGAVLLLEILQLLPQAGHQVVLLPQMRSVFRLCKRERAKRREANLGRKASAAEEIDLAPQGAQQPYLNTPQFLLQFQRTGVGFRDKLPLRVHRIFVLLLREVLPAIAKRSTTERESSPVVRIFQLPTLSEKSFGVWHTTKTPRQTYLRFF